MSTNTPGYQYGRAAGLFNRAVTDFWADVARGMRDVQSATQKAMEKMDSEALRNMMYQERIEREKRLARLYLKKLIREERAYWGLS